MANGPLVKIFLQILGPNLTKLGRKHQYGKKDNYETVKKVVCLKKNIFFKNNAATNVITNTKEYMYSEDSNFLKLLPQYEHWTPRSGSKLKIKIYQENVLKSSLELPFYKI